jgi:ring-1,2-phenylacetyl-CoA epoxidase subunit PaaD
VTPVTVDPRALVGAIADPELPVLSIEDLGILRSVETGEGGALVVTITPTYSGCPALDAIRAEIHATLADHGFERVEVRTVLRPPWTTDWINERGRARLHALGIAPPRPRCGQPLLQLAVTCPRCDSANTRLVSRFGSTLCKAHRVCNECGEPFDHFKEL